MGQLEEPVAAHRQPAWWWARKTILVLGPLALAGEVGHQLLGRLGQAVAHHLFHILFAGGAVVVFAAFVLVDVRRHGRPTFSWHLRPRTPAAGGR